MKETKTEIRNNEKSFDEIILKELNLLDSLDKALENIVVLTFATSIVLDTNMEIKDIGKLRKKLLLLRKRINSIYCNTKDVTDWLNEQFFILNELSKK